MGNLGRLVCAYCLLKDDMPFVSGSYMIEVNYCIEKSGFIFFFFQKAKKNGSHDFNPEVTEKGLTCSELTTHFTIIYTQIHVFATYSRAP